MTRKTSNPLRQFIIENRITCAPISQINEAFKGKDGSVYWRHQGKTYKKGPDGVKKEIGEQEYIAAKPPKGQALAAKRGRTNINTSQVGAAPQGKSVSLPKKPKIPIDDLVDGSDFEDEEEYEEEKERVSSLFSNPTTQFKRGSDLESVSRAHPDSLFDIDHNSSFKIPDQPDDWEVTSHRGQIRINSFKTGERLATFPAHTTQKLLDSQKQIMQMAKTGNASA
jgi:hypothetical protein